MSRNIPFFEMFAELQASPELRLRLAGALLTYAQISQKDLSIELRLTVRDALTPEELQSLRSRSMTSGPAAVRRNRPAGLRNRRNRRSRRNRKNRAADPPPGSGPPTEKRKKGPGRISRRCWGTPLRAAPFP